MAQSFSSASSSAISSSSGRVGGDQQLLQIDAPPPAAAFMALPVAGPLRMILRMASAAAAKKCPRESQCCDCRPPTSRRYASCTGCRGLQGLPRILGGHFLRGQAAQLFVDQRQKLFGRLTIALLDGSQNLRVTSLMGNGHSSPFISGRGTLDS